MSYCIEGLYCTERRYVLGVLRRYGVREADLEDVCNDVFVIVLDRIADFQGRSHVRTWLYSICRWTAANYRRRQMTRTRFMQAWSA